MLDALLCLTDPGDEVILTDPTYAGMLNRVRLAGAVPRLVPMHSDRNGWRMDLDALSAAATDRTRVVFLNNASFPTGWVATDAEWEAVTKLCNDADLWLLYWAGFEAVLYDGRDVVHPAALPGMRERTVIVGAPSFEQRMIAWRVGWMVMPGELTDPASRTQIYNWSPAASLRSGRRWRSSWGTTTPRRRPRSGSCAATRHCGSWKGCRSSPRTAPGRRSSTPGSSVHTCRARRGCSTTRSQRRRWTGGEARSQPGT